MEILLLILDTLRDRRWLAAAAGGCLAAVIVVAFIVTPRAESALHLYRSMREQAERIAAARRWKPRLVRLRAQTQRLSRRVDSLSVALPRGDRISTVLGVLQEAADRSGVRVRRVQPREVIHHSSYEELPLDVAVDGSFHPIARFVDSLERSAYLVKVQQLHVDTDAITTTDLEARLTIHLVTLSSAPVDLSGD